MSLLVSQICNYFLFESNYVAFQTIIGWFATLKFPGLLIFSRLIPKVKFSLMQVVNKSSFYENNAHSKKHDYHSNFYYIDRHYINLDNCLIVTFSFSNKIWNKEGVNTFLYIQPIYLFVYHLFMSFCFFLFCMLLLTFY